MSEVCESFNSPFMRWKGESLCLAEEKISSLDNPMGKGEVHEKGMPIRLNPLFHMFKIGESKIFRETSKISVLKKTVKGL